MASMAGRLSSGLPNRLPRPGNPLNVIFGIKGVVNRPDRASRPGEIRTHANLQIWKRTNDPVNVRAASFLCYREPGAATRVPIVR